MTRQTSLPAVACALLLSACGSVPLGSLPQLSRIEPQTTDLSALRVALSVPETIRPRPGGMNMDVTLTATGEPERKTTFRLEEAAAPDDLAGLPATDRAGYRTYAFRLTPEDAARFDALRAKALSKRGNGRKGSIGIGIATRQLCRTGAVPEGALLATTYLRTSETGTYVTLTRNLDLTREKALAGAIAKLEPC